MKVIVMKVIEDGENVEPIKYGQLPATVIPCHSYHFSLIEALEGDQ